MSRWTEAEDAILVEHYPRGRVAACRAHGLTRSAESIRSRVAKLKIHVKRIRKPRKPPKVRASAWTQAEDAIMLEHYRTGGPVACRRAGLKRSQPSMVSRARVLGVRPNRAAIAARRESAEPAWALPRHDLLESLECVRLRKWRGPVSPAPLRWAA